MSARADIQFGERRKRADAYDKAEFDSYDDQQLEEREREALEEFRQAVAVDPVWKAWVKVRGWRIYRMNLALSMQQLGEALEEGSPYPRRISIPGSGTERFETALTDALRPLIYAEADRLEEERAEARRRAIQGKE